MSNVNIIFFGPPPPQNASPTKVKPMRCRLGSTRLIKDRITGIGYKLWDHIGGIPCGYRCMWILHHLIYRIFVTWRRKSDNIENDGSNAKFTLSYIQCYLVTFICCNSTSDTIPINSLSSNCSNVSNGFMNLSSKYSWGNVDGKPFNGSSEGVDDTCLDEPG